MADSKKGPIQHFTADLFSSPGPTLSLNVNEPFNSPISLRPALVTATTSSSSKDGAAQVTPSKISSSSQQSSPAVGVDKGSPRITQVDSSSSSEVSHSHSVDGMSTVSLDSPTVSASTSNDSAVTGQGRQGTESIMGWNDPPSITPYRPEATRTFLSQSAISSPLNSSADDIQIQPLAGIATSQSQGEVPGTGSNPYRIGTSIGTRKPAYASSSGIASFGSYSSPAVQSNPPAMVPDYQPISLQQQSAVYQTTDNTWPNRSTGEASPIQHHWFYLRSQEKYWIPFSLLDSGSLETAMLQNQDPSQQVLVPTDGGRYDVELHSRQRRAVYWDEPVSKVRRCSWFFKGESDRWYLPYDEAIALKLEEEFQVSVNQSTWNHRVDIEEKELVIMHSYSSIVHYSTSSSTLDPEESHTRPKAVMRGFADLDKIEMGEQSRIDHLVFVVHGIGSHCDLSFRSLVDCVDDFREVSQLMLKTHHFSNQAPRDGDNGGRAEYLPVHWHKKLHTCGVDDSLKPLTLPSITRLRDFTNSTLLDILYFTSPLYCQTIIAEIASEMNRMYELFKARNPHFHGGVSVAGHSLGSVILFDLLCHQHGDTSQKKVDSTDQDTSLAPGPGRDLETPGNEGERGTGGGAGEEDTDGTIAVEDVLTQLGLESMIETFHKEEIDFDSLLMCSNEDLKELGLAMGPRKKLSSYITQQNEEKAVKEQRTKEMALKLEQERRYRESTDAPISGELLRVKIIKGVAGTGQAYVEYPQLLFQPKHLFALGSPIGLFLTVRGVEGLGPEFSLPTCPSVFNIFHPFDPVAYRIEPLVTTSAPDRALLMAHHKGRKRFHLELYENLGNVGATIKHSIVEGMRNMWQQLNEFARSHTTGAQSIDQFYQQQQELQPTSEIDEIPEDSSETVPSPKEEEIRIGTLNGGRRIDHVLQEKPIEKLNEYLFALSSHLCYWRSEDTALFLLKEVYQESNPVLIKS